MRADSHSDTANGSEMPPVLTLNAAGRRWYNQLESTDIATGGRDTRRAVWPMIALLVILLSAAAHAGQFYEHEDGLQGM